MIAQKIELNVHVCLFHNNFIVSGWNIKSGQSGSNIADVTSPPQHQRLWSDRQLHKDEQNKVPDNQPNPPVGHIGAEVMTPSFGAGSFGGMIKDDDHHVPRVIEVQTHGASPIPTINQSKLAESKSVDSPVFSPGHFEQISGARQLRNQPILDEKSLLSAFSKAHISINDERYLFYY